MALDSSTGANNILDAITSYAYTDSDGKSLTDDAGSPIIQSKTLSFSDFADVFATAYHNYASNGTVPGAESGDGDKSILSATLTACYENGSNLESINILAQGLADYWATVCVTPGDPAHGGTTVTDVTNDSSSRVLAYKTAIENSYRSSKTLPYFEHFVENVEAVVKTVIWTVTETVDGSPKTFTESIT